MIVEAAARFVNREFLADEIEAAQNSAAFNQGASFGFNFLRVFGSLSPESDAKAKSKVKEYEELAGQCEGVLGKLLRAKEHRLRLLNYTILGSAILGLAIGLVR